MPKRCNNIALTDCRRHCHLLKLLITCNVIHGRHSPHLFYSDNITKITFWRYQYQLPFHKASFSTTSKNSYPSILLRIHDKLLFGNFSSFLHPFTYASCISSYHLHPLYLSIMQTLWLVYFNVSRVKSFIPRIFTSHNLHPCWC